MHFALHTIHDIQTLKLDLVKNDDVHIAHSATDDLAIQGFRMLAATVLF